MTVKIKPLDWTPTKIDGEHLRDTARGVDGKLVYEVGVTPGNYYLMLSPVTGGLRSSGNFPSEAAAKAAAQTDYDARILSAIEA